MSFSVTATRKELSLDLTRVKPKNIDKTLDGTYLADFGIDIFKSLHVVHFANSTL